ncbi:MAG: PEP-CTERM sorting domain-containing protein [Planctomycetota bacterium]
MITVINPGFEDTSGQSTFNEFTFGMPAGWDFYDPNGIIGSSGVFVGTLLPNGTEFFNDTAPEGDRVSILFNSSREGDGEYGFEQTLDATLQADSDYRLTVEVGNIASGFATNGTFFNLDEFPGYRVDLLAGGQVLASDLNSLTIDEGEFALATIDFRAGADHALIGEALGIRLVSLNEIPSGFTQATSPDLEVDFDDVRLSVTSVPEPSALGLVAASAFYISLRRGRRAARR